VNEEVLVRVGPQRHKKKKKGIGKIRITQKTTHKIKIFQKQKKNKKNKFS